MVRISALRVIGAPLLHAHADALVAESPEVELDTAALAEQERTFRAELREQYGRDKAEKLLEATAQFVAKHPALAAIIGRRGFGQGAAAKQFTEALIEHVRKLNPQI